MAGKDHDAPRPEDPAFDADAVRWMARLGCACVESPGCCDLPEARTLFRRVELAGEPLEAAAAALGLDPRAAGRLLYDARRRALATLLCALAAPSGGRRDH